MKKHHHLNALQFCGVKGVKLPNVSATNPMDCNDDDDDDDSGSSSDTDDGNYDE